MQVIRNNIFGGITDIQTTGVLRLRIPGIGSCPNSHTISSYTRDTPWIGDREDLRRSSLRNPCSRPHEPETLAQK